MLMKCLNNWFQSFEISIMIDRIGIAWQGRDRHPGMWSQVGLRKHDYKQS